jgi:putative transposase
MRAQSITAPLPDPTAAQAWRGTNNLAAENRILKLRLKGRLKLSDAERATLGEIGHRLGRHLLAEVATVAKPDTILTWYRKLVARARNGC